MTFDMAFVRGTATQRYLPESIGWVLEDRLKRSSVLYAAASPGGGGIASLVLAGVAVTKRLAGLQLNPAADKVMAEWRKSLPAEQTRGIAKRD